ncbi:hypothetical protein BKA63DRAFT_523572 [Paraphoma chrysanthemicola]|nr:hypothetical protein BKA63DRAFT_523572 [Paraphoma chrysanthemicola]
MASALPAIPRYIFTIFEPAILLVAFLTISLFPRYYVSSQSPLDPPSRPLTAPEEILVYQLSNVFLLIAFTSLYVLNSTNDVKVARAWLSALWWGDLGHIGVTAWCMDWETFSSVGTWTMVNWANLSIPSLLFSLRSLYFLGMFGPELAKDANKVF